MHNNVQEFDQYIENYRTNCDKALSMSGETSDFFALYKAQKLQEWFPHFQNKKINILDFGCGDGLMAHYVKKAFVDAEVIGLDPSEKSIEFARANYPNVYFKAMQGVRIPLPNQCFDLIYAAGVFHHIPVEDHKVYLTELYRLLAPRGILVLFELNPLNPCTVYTFKHNPIDVDAHMMTPWYTKKLLKRFKQKVEIRYYCFFPNFLKNLRGIEKYMLRLPFGALYAAILRNDV
jgi:ubiquinone/menaquinone biosynthesis C-methylase UbiE